MAKNQEDTFLAYGHSVAFLDKYRDQKGEFTGMNLAKSKNAPLQGEIVRADTAAVTKPIQTHEVASIAERLQDLTNQMLETLDLSKRDFLDKFRTIDGRIGVRIERSGQLGALIAAFGANIDQFRIVAEKMGALQRVAVQQQLQRMEDEYALLQAQIRIDNAHEEARRRWRLEEARVNTEIAKLEAEAEKARRDALPPPPVLPGPPPVDEATRSKEAARRQKQQEVDLNHQNLDMQADAAEENVARAKARAVEIFNNETYNTGETYTRICKVLDEYQVDRSILPEKIRDFLNSNDITEEPNYDVQ